MEKRRLELIEAECRRHAALARVDAARRAEHEEVAEALAWALRCLGKEEPICVSVRLTPLSPPPSARKLGARTQKPSPRRVTGHIEYINRAHRYFTVRVDTGRGILRESFKF